MEEAEAAVTTLTAQRNALAWIDEKNAALADAQASADASHAAEADAVGVLDLQIFGNGESDGEAAGAVFGLAPTSAGGAWDIPLTVLRKGVAHDAQSAPNTWHLMSEE